MGGNIRILNLLKTSAIDVQSARVWYSFLSYFAIGLWAQKVRSVSGPVRLFMSNEIPTQNENSQNAEKGEEGKGFCKDSNFSNFFPQKGALVICLECTRGFESFWSMSKRGQILVSKGEKRVTLIVYNYSNAWKIRGFFVDRPMSALLGRSCIVGEWFWLNVDVKIGWALSTVLIGVRMMLWAEKPFDPVVRRSLDIFDG